MKVNPKATIAIIVAMLISMAACTGKQYTTTQKTSANGAGLGALTGAILGQAIGKDTDSTLIGASIGAGIGALTGFAFGTYLDEQEKNLREQFAATENVKVTRLSENELMVSFDSTTTFNIDSAALSLQANKQLKQASGVFNEYPDTAVIVRGHADDTGTANYNLNLSDQRAQTVQQTLISNGVQPERLIAVGYGETQPIATNDTEEGRRQNRRVELLIKQLEG